MKTILVCKAHPEFRGEYRPSSACLVCLEIYKCEHEIDECVWEGWYFPVLEYAMGVCHEESTAAGEEFPGTLPDAPWAYWDEVLHDKRMSVFMDYLKEHGDYVEVDDDEDE